MIRSRMRLGGTALLLFVLTVLLSLALVAYNSTNPGADHHIVLGVAG